MTSTWYFKSFNDLTPNELYDILQLRQQVFQIEQHCLYPDIDGIDRRAEHLIHYRENELSAYLRIFEAEPFIIFGRVVVSKKMRKSGLGKSLINKCLSFINKNHPEHTIKISAQLYLKKFYESFGFVTIGEPYDEDGIMHIIMKKIL